MGREKELFSESICFLEYPGIPVKRIAQAHTPYWIVKWIKCVLIFFRDFFQLALKEPIPVLTNRD